MATRITGLDLGTYSVKVVHLEGQREIKLVGYDEEKLAAHVVAATEAEGGPPSGAPGDGDLENEPTSVRAPQEPGAAGEAAADANVAGEGPADDGAAGDDEWHAGNLELEEDDPLAEAPAWVRAVHALALRDPFGGSSVVTYLPDGKAMTIGVEVPFDQKQKVASILPHLLLDRLPLDLKHVVYDFQVGPGSNPGQNEAIVGFARRDELGEFLEDARLGGIEPVVVGVPELMLRYVAEKAAPEGLTSFAVIDIGHTFTRLLVMHDGRPVLSRSIRLGGHNLTEAIAKRFNASYEEAERAKHTRAAILEPAEAADPAMLALSEAVVGALRPLVRELRRSFQALFASDRIKVEKILVCGGTSRLKNLMPFLHGEFSVDTERFAIEDTISLAEVPTAHGQGAELPMALALALQQATDRSEKKLVNLRQGPYAYRGKSSYVRSQITRLGLAAAVLICLLAVFLAAQRMEQRAQMEAMREAVIEQSTKLFGEPLDTQAKIQARLAGEQTSEKSFVPRMSAYELLYNLTRHMDDDISVSLERAEVDVDRNLVQLIGVTTNPQAVDRLASALERLECLREVKKDKLQVQSDTEVRFELHISSGCS